MWATRPERDTLKLRYKVKGDTDGMTFPEWGRGGVPSRADGLWRHTCFEAFLRPSRGPGYYEFNFATSIQWAAYHFDGPRSGMSEAPEVELRLLGVASERTGFSVQARVRGLPKGRWRLGLAAVIETAEGLSYWALKHPPGKPDFHHSDCFVLELPCPP